MFLLQIYVSQTGIHDDQAFAGKYCRSPKILNKCGLSVAYENIDEQEDEKTNPQLYHVSSVKFQMSDLKIFQQVPSIKVYLKQL